MAMRAQDVYAILNSRIEDIPSAEDGFSPIITENKDNDENTYKLDIVTKDATITTPNLKGQIGPQGIPGEKGDKGDPFTVSKVYDSIEEMNTGFATDDVPQGGFVVIDTGSVEDEDNAKLYIKGISGYVFITDLSGATGIRGPQGIQGTSLRLRGAWAPNTEYLNNTQYIDTVTYNGSTWACNLGHTSGTNWDETKWTLLSAKGEPGTTTYTELTDKPKINGIELLGEKTLEDIGALSINTNLPFNFSIERPNENSPYVNISYGEYGEPAERKFQLYLPKEQFVGNLCFIANELYSFYQDLGGAPTTYNMVAWKDTDKIEDLNEENGPYLVLSAQSSTSDEDGSSSSEIYQYVISLHSCFEGYITEETDPTVPDWAKQETKPTYTAEEVGATSSDSFSEITPEAVEGVWSEVFTS